MNKLFFLLTKQNIVKTHFSNDIDFIFKCKNTFVDCLIINKPQSKSFCLKNLDKQMLDRVLSIPNIKKDINKEFESYLDVHYEAKTTLADILFLLKNKESISQENKSILTELFAFTAENFCCPLTNNISLKMLTSCNKTAKAGYDLHFQLCINQGDKTVLPWQSHAETLASIHTILLDNKEQVLQNLQNATFKESIKSAENLTRYNKLKNRFFETDLQK